MRHGPGVIRIAPTGFPRLSAPTYRLEVVEDNTEFACSQVTTMEVLLPKMLASVSWNMMRLIQVSLKKDKKVCLYASGFLRVPSLPPVLFSTAPVPG
jgi:hypothetical protein